MPNPFNAACEIALVFLLSFALPHFGFLPLHPLLHAQACTRLSPTRSQLTLDPCACLLRQFLPSNKMTNSDVVAAMISALGWVLHLLLLLPLLLFLSLELCKILHSFAFLTEHGRSRCKYRTCRMLTKRRDQKANNQRSNRMVFIYDGGWFESRAQWGGGGKPHKQ